MKAEVWIKLIEEGDSAIYFEKYIKEGKVYHYSLHVYDKRYLKIYLPCDIYGNDSNTQSVAIKTEVVSLNDSDKGDNIFRGQLHITGSSPICAYGWLEPEEGLMVAKSKIDAIFDGYDVKMI